MKPKEEIELIFQAKRFLRAHGIDWLRHHLKELGEPIDAVHAAARWDMQYAERTTNAKQLREIGIEPPDIESLTDDEIDDALEDVVRGLKLLGISILGADNMCPKKMYQLLTQKILHDDVPDIPPNDGVTEYIDLTPHHSKETV
jgi:hypothetical protein